MLGEKLGDDEELLENDGVVDGVILEEGGDAVRR